MRGRVSIYYSVRASAVCGVHDLEVAAINTLALYREVMLILQLNGLKSMT